MKLCKNCKYYAFIGDASIGDRCKHSASVWHTDPINGYAFYTKCWSMRDDSSKCSVDAKFYEEKEPSLLTRMMFWKKSTHKPD